MWDRSLFALRRLSVDLGRRMGSWRLSVALMVVAALYYAFLAIWSTSSPPHVVLTIALLLPFWFVYALLLLNTGVCLWQRLPTLPRDIARAPRWRGTPPWWNCPAAPEIDENAAVRILRRNRFRVTLRSRDKVLGVSRRWAALGTFLFHGAFFLVALGFLLTLLSRQEAKVWVAAGEEYTADPGQFLSVSPPRVLSTGVPPLEFRVDRIAPEFWRDQLLFTELAADLEFPDGSQDTTRINRPLWIGFSTFLRLSGFGYAPRYELVDSRGRVIDSAFVKLDVFPPGRRDYFKLPDYPHRFYIEVYPDYAAGDGGPSTRSFDLVAPGIALKVFRGRLDLGGSVLQSDDGYEFEGLTLRFPEIRYWGEFSIVKDRGASVLFFGYLMGLTGLLLRIRGRRREVEWLAGGAGRPGEFRIWGDRAGMTPEAKG
jgi:hypothetical protein